LVLFGDLKEKNRQKFYEVRIESLQTSIKQINNMHKQIQIDYTILPPDFFEKTLVDAEHNTIMSSIASLEACIELLGSVNQK
jgi:prefoldin subunit 5